MSSLATPLATTTRLMVIKRFIVTSPALTTLPKAGKHFLTTLVQITSHWAIQPVSTSLREVIISTLALEVPLANPIQSASARRALRRPRVSPALVEQPLLGASESL